MKHPIHREVFDTDDSKGIDDLAALLVGEVLPPPCDSFMDSRNGFPVFASLRSPFRQFGVLTLYLCQCFLFLAKEAWVFNLRPIRKRSKGVESYINPDLLLTFRQAFRITFNGERDIPFASRGMPDSTGLALALDGTVIDHLDISYFRKADSGIMRDAKATLRKGEAIISSLALEAGKARFFRMFSYPTKKSLELMRLFLGGIETILICFTHVCIVAQTVALPSIEPLHGRLSIPRSQDRGFSPRFRKLVRIDNTRGAAP